MSGLSSCCANIGGPECVCPPRSIADLAGIFAVQPDAVNHPPHYTWLGGIEVIDITEHMGFCLGNVVKYVLRADHKGQPIQDLEKAAWYLNREIANRKSNPPRKPGGEQ